MSNCLFSNFHLLWFVDETLNVVLEKSDLVSYFEGRDLPALGAATEKRGTHWIFNSTYDLNGIVIIYYWNLTLYTHRIIENKMSAYKRVI